LWRPIVRDEQEGSGRRKQKLILREGLAHHSVEGFEGGKTRTEAKSYLVRQRKRPLGLEWGFGCVEREKGGGGRENSRRQVEVWSSVSEGKGAWEFQREKDNH